MKTAAEDARPVTPSERAPRRRAHKTGQIAGAIDENGAITGTFQIDYNSDGTINENADMTGGRTDDGHIVRGLLTFPATALGKTFWVAVDTDQNGGNGQVAVGGGKCSSGLYACYLINNVPAGTYYIYAVVNMNELPSAPVSGDFMGWYDVNPPAPSAAVNSNNGSFPITLTVTP